jgi:ABC-2 type transport system permease protein
MVPRIREIFKWRGLLFVLALKDFRKKYRYATGGLGWMFFVPLVQTLIFFVVFKFIFRVAIENYPLFLLAGLFPWSFLKSSLDAGANSILNNAGLIKKTYFPRQILPFSQVITNLFNFSFSLTALLILCLFYKTPFLNAIFWVVPVIFIQLLLISGIALFFAAVNSIYRETQFILDILLFSWFYATPIVYPLEMARNMLSAGLFKLYSLNPLIGIIYGYQRIFIYGANPDPGLLAQSALFSIAVLLFGEFVFIKSEKIFVDMV